MTEHHHIAGKGACPHPDCVTATAPPGPAITVDDLDNLRHMLGIEPERSRGAWGYRNHFCSSRTDPSMLRLEKVGFVRFSRMINGGKDAIFMATHQGCQAAGMTAVEISKMEPNP